MKTQRSRGSSEPPRSAMSQAWVDEMKDRAPRFRKIIGKKWEDAERDHIEDWEQKTGIDPRDLQRTLDGMRRAGLVSFDTKYRQLIDSIRNDTVSEGDTAVRIDSGVDLLKSEGTHRINAWCRIKIGDTHDWVAAHQEEYVFSESRKSLPES